MEENEINDATLYTNFPRWNYPTGIPAGIPDGYLPGIPRAIPAVPPFFGQPPSGLLTGYPAGIPGRSGIPVGSIENILVNI